MSGSYDTAQICPNGHVANDSLQQTPQHSRQYCEQCGEKTLVACPSCNRPIRGDYQVPGVFGVGTYQRPAYCHACGAAFPWTDKAIQAALQLSLEEGHLEGQDAIEFKEAVGNIVRDTSATPIGISRMRKLMAKVGPASAGLFREVLKDVISESVKKAIWGG